MGDWHQDIVFKNVPDNEVDNVAEQVVQYLIKSKIISDKKANNVLSENLGFCPGKNWDFVVDYPEEKHFLELITNGMEIKKGRNVFWADGQEFEKIECSNCGGNNLGCDWGELFSKWIEDPNSANLECEKCGESNSIGEYIFEPKWALSNLGFTFWNWPLFNASFLTKLEELTGKEIELVEGKL